MPENKNNTFYNVMPEVTTGPMKRPLPTAVVSKPTTTTTPTPVPSAPQIATTTGINLPPTKKAGFFTGKKLLIEIAVFILLALAAFGVYMLVFKDEAPTDDIVINTNETTPQENPDVTTPAEWLQKFFGTETCTELVTCGDKADPDRDGLENKAEYDTGTDPNNNDSDSDGLADGDESMIFNTDPLITRTFRGGEYNDIDFAKGGYDISTNEPYTNEALFNIKSKVKQFGLHQPTLTSLGQLSFQLYDFTDPSLPPLPANLDISPEAKLDRDSQRQSTIKKVGGALLKYKEEKKQFPGEANFVAMADAIQPYNTVATNYNDPINLPPFTYGYQPAANNSEFILTYYSETQNQLIKYLTKNAQDDVAREDTKAYDEQRKLDLENIQQALLVYSSTQLDPASGVQYVFPTKENMRGALIPRYITTLPQDPITKLDYAYEVGENFDTFIIRAPLQNPTTGTTGYLCNQLECKAY